jgi:hypothetical protein
MDPKVCQVCGERFGIWIGPPMTDGLCPMTSRREVCKDAAAKAYAAAMCRKICPEAYDETGRIKKDGDALFRMMDAMAAAGLDWETGRPLKERRHA